MPANTTLPACQPQPRFNGADDDRRTLRGDVALVSGIQVAVDRRFDRARYDGQQLVGAFGERLRGEVDLESIQAEVPATVDAAVRPATVELWLRERQGAGQ